MRPLLCLLLIGCDDQTFQHDPDPPDLGPVPPTEDCPLAPADTPEAAREALTALYTCYGYPSEVACTAPETRWLCYDKPGPDYHVNGYEETQCTATVDDHPELTSRQTFALSEHTLPAHPGTTPRNARVAHLCEGHPDCVGEFILPFGPRDGVLTSEDAVTSAERRLRCCGHDPTEFEINCWGPADCLWGEEVTREGIRAIGEVQITCRVFDLAEGVGMYWSLYPLEPIRP